MESINIIRDDLELSEFIDATTASGWAAMDTEFLRESTYWPRLCLIQIASQAGAACIDPLALDDLAPLGDLLANPAVVKIFHSCSQDLEALDTRMALAAGNLYDTQLAAAFCGYGNQVSYAALVESMCAVRLPKAHTRTNWSRRPLSSAQLEYAMDDVKYLPELRAQLNARLAAKGRIHWHRAECEAAVAPANYRLDADAIWLRLKGIERLDAAARADARKLAGWRERKARDRNRPRGWILSTPALLQICRQRPRTLDELARIDDITPAMLKHIGKDILAVIHAGAGGNGGRPGNNQGHRNEDHAELDPTGQSEQRLSNAQRGQVRRIMDLLERRATEAEISQSLFANRREIENFVRGKTDAPLFTGWRAALAGDEILAGYSCGGANGNRQSQ